VPSIDGSRERILTKLEFIRLTDRGKFWEIAEWIYREMRQEKKNETENRHDIKDREEREWKSLNRWTFNFRLLKKLIDNLIEGKWIIINRSEKWRAKKIGGFSLEKKKANIQNEKKKQIFKTRKNAKRDWKTYLIEVL